MALHDIRLCLSPDQKLQASGCEVTKQSQRKTKESERGTARTGRVGNLLIPWDLPSPVLTRWELGRAFAMSGETTKAAYQEFLSLWKDADPDVPILRQAKAEYSRLR